MKTLPRGEKHEIVIFYLSLLSCKSSWISANWLSWFRQPELNWWWKITEPLWQLTFIVWFMRVTVRQWIVNYIIIIFISITVLYLVKVSTCNLNDLINLQFNLIFYPWTILILMNSLLSSMVSLTDSYWYMSSNALVSLITHLFGILLDFLLVDTMPWKIQDNVVIAYL